MAGKKKTSIKISEVSPKVPITKEGLSKLRKKLEHLIRVERPAISQQIADARDKGDLSENAEYDAAKNSQAMLELKIFKIGETIRKSRVIDESKIDSSKVQILSKIKIKNTKNNSIMEFIIVPESEANLKAGKISVSSPIAKGLLGKVPGDIVKIKVPSGVSSFEIVEISRM